MQTFEWSTETKQCGWLLGTVALAVVLSVGQGGQLEEIPGVRIPLPQGSLAALWYVIGAAAAFFLVLISRDVFSWRAAKARACFAIGSRVDARTAQQIFDDEVAAAQARRHESTPDVIASRRLRVLVILGYVATPLILSAWAMKLTAG